MARGGRLGVHHPTWRPAQAGRGRRLCSGIRQTPRTRRGGDARHGIRECNGRNSRRMGTDPESPRVHAAGRESVCARSDEQDHGRRAAASVHHHVRVTETPILGARKELKGKRSGERKNVVGPTTFFPRLQLGLSYCSCPRSWASLAPLGGAPSWFHPVPGPSQERHAQRCEPSGESPLISSGSRVPVLGRKGCSASRPLSLGVVQLQTAPHRPLRREAVRKGLGGARQDAAGWSRCA